MFRKILKFGLPAVAAVAAAGLMVGQASATPGPRFTPSAVQVATDAQCANPGFSNETGTYTGTDCGKAGYVASGRQFRYIQDETTIPVHYGDPTVDPYTYVALDASGNNNDFARAGIFPVGFGPSGWVAYVDIQSSGTPVHVQVPLALASEGDGIFMSVYLTQNDNGVHVVIRTPDQSIVNTTYAVDSPTYTDAQALVDWTQAASSFEPAPAPPAETHRDFQITQGAITTLSGVQGTFRGPWTLTAVDATSNGSLPPDGSLIGQPSYLWTDGNSLHGMSGDAFGVWRYPF